jgi:hypothetical protein
MTALMMRQMHILRELLELVRFSGCERDILARWHSELLLITFRFAADAAPDDLYQFTCSRTHPSPPA